MENKCTVSVCVFKTTIMQGAEKMYQALLFSLTEEFSTAQKELRDNPL